MGEQKILLDAPYLIVLNQKEYLHVEKQSDAKWSVLFFEPKILDIKYTFTYIENADRSDVTSPEVQSLYLFNIFLLRDDENKAHCRLSQMILQRVLGLLKSANLELSQQTTYYWICRSRSYLIELLCYLSQSMSGEVSISTGVTETVDYYSGKLEDILLYIHTNYEKKITMTSLVSFSGINRTTINEMFKRQVGESFVTYLTKLRIHAASLMLQETGLLIKEIAGRVGYEDLTHFTRSFKKATGFTPGDYRKEYSWMQH